MAESVSGERAALRQGRQDAASRVFTPDDLQQAGGLLTSAAIIAPEVAVLGPESAAASRLEIGDRVPLQIENPDLTHSLQPSIRRTNYNLPVYSPQLLDHFQNPRNVGEVEAADAAVELENPACGDILKLTARCEGGRIVEIRFRAKGCVPAMACGSAITELVRGKTVEEARQVGREDLIQKVGGLPEASKHAGHLAVDALQMLLRKL